MNNTLTGRHVLLIADKLPSSFQHRMWQQAYALKDAGANVSIMGARNELHIKKHEVLNGIHIHSHRYENSSKNFWRIINAYCKVITVWRLFLTEKVSITQAYNAPGWLAFIIMPFTFFGVKYIVDYSEGSDEIRNQFTIKTFLYKAAAPFSAFTQKTVRHIIAKNEYYKKFAIRQNGLKEKNFVIIQDGIDLDILKTAIENTAYKKGRTHLICCIGNNLNEEDMLLLLESYQLMLQMRKNAQLAIIHNNTAVDAEQLAIGMGMQKFIDFYKDVPDEQILELINTADICVNTGKNSHANNFFTTDNIITCMAMKKAMVQFNIKEYRCIARKASLYAKDTVDFAFKMNELLANESLRKQMGEFGYQRIVNEYSCEQQNSKLVKFYNHVLNNTSAEAPVINYESSTSKVLPSNSYNTAKR